MTSGLRGETKLSNITPIQNLDTKARVYEVWSIKQRWSFKMKGRRRNTYHSKCLKPLKLVCLSKLTFWTLKEWGKRLHLYANHGRIRQQVCTTLWPLCITDMRNSMANQHQLSHQRFSPNGPSSLSKGFSIWNTYPSSPLHRNRKGRQWKTTRQTQMHTLRGMTNAICFLERSYSNWIPESISQINLIGGKKGKRHSQSTQLWGYRKQALREDLGKRLQANNTPTYRSEGPKYLITIPLIPSSFIPLCSLRRFLFFFCRIYLKTHPAHGTLPSIRPRYAIQLNPSYRPQKMTNENFIDFINRLGSKKPSTI